MSAAHNRHNSDVRFPLKTTASDEAAAFDPKQTLRVSRTRTAKTAAAQQKLLSCTLLLAVPIFVASCALEKTYKCELVIETSTLGGTERWSGAYEIVRSLGPEGYKAANWRGQAIPIGIGGGKFVYALPIGSDHAQGYLPFLYLSAFGEGAPRWGRLIGRAEVWPDPPERSVFSYAPRALRELPNRLYPTDFIRGAPDHIGMPPAPASGSDH